MAARSTSALLIVRNDRIVFEWDAQGTFAGTKLATASTAKGVFGGLAAAIEIGDGLVGLDEHRSMRCDGDVETQRDVRLKTERGALGQLERFPPPWQRD